MKAADDPSFVLLEQLDKLDKAGQKFGIPWEDAALKQHYRGRRDQFENLIRHGSTADQQIARKFLAGWATQLSAKKKAMAATAGVSPKSVPPPKTPKIFEGSLSETMGLTANERDIVLRAHNEHRKTYHAAALEYDLRLEAHAQAWANHLAARFAKGVGSLDHNTENRTVDGLNGTTGENLTMAAGNGFRPGAYTPDHREPVDGWVAEVADYDLVKKAPKAGKTTHDTGHFTQVVWKGTKRVGCGFALVYLAGGAFYAVWVCNYHPGGNVVGRDGENVN